MKKFLAIVLCLIMVLAVFAGCTKEPVQNPSEGGQQSTGDGEQQPTGDGEQKPTGDAVIKIGVFEPASGDNGAGGKQEVLGIRYAKSVCPTVEIGGVQYKIELVEVDNQSATDKAPTAAQQLISQGVSVVLGSYGSGVSIAAGDIFKDAKTPAIGCSCTNPAVTEGNDYYFRVCFLDPFQGTVMANYAVNGGAETAYVLTQLGDDYSTGLGKYFADAFEKLGGKVIKGEFQEGNSDFSAYLTNATNGKADVFFSPTSTTAASLILAQAKAADVKFPIMAGDTWENSVILDAAKGSSLKVALSTFFDENDKSGAASEFVKGFKAWLNADSANLKNNGDNDIVAAVSALGYDAYMVAVEALKASASTKGEDVAKVLPQVTYSGVTGSISFDENGDAKKDMAYIKSVDTEKGEFKFEKTQSVADLG